jgi:hypothetical protein
MHERVYDTVHTRMLLARLARFLMHSPTTLGGGLDLVMVLAESTQVRVFLATQRVDVITVCGLLWTTSTG